MPNATTLAIFKELKKPASISELANLLGLDHSTVSTAVSSLVTEGHYPIFQLFLRRR